MSIYYKCDVFEEFLCFRSIIEYTIHMTIMFKTKMDNSSEWMIPKNICRSCTLSESLCQRQEFQNKSRILLSNSIYIWGILNNQIPSFIHTYIHCTRTVIHSFIQFHFNLSDEQLQKTKAKQCINKHQPNINGNGKQVLQSFARFPP